MPEPVSTFPNQADGKGIPRLDRDRAVAIFRVVLTEAGRNISHNSTTDVAGRYYLTALPPGKYTR